jgi:YesN/AraC family two-component response regulator
VDYLIKPLIPDDLEKLIRETLSSVGQEPTVTTRAATRAKPVELLAVKKKLEGISSSESQTSAQTQQSAQSQRRISRAHKIHQRAMGRPQPLNSH